MSMSCLAVRHQNTAKRRYTSASNKLFHMMESKAAAFWSYAHEDDELDQKAILVLADRLRAEFSLITGEELSLFVDRTDISWGEEWRTRIDRALVQTTFFIPLVSPRYFTRDECRHELLEFDAQAQSLGVGELILPILYVTLPNFTADNPDEAIALTARMQYEDWRELRLFDRDSQEYRRAVNALAQRLADIASEVTVRQIDQEAQADDEHDVPHGLGDMLVEIGPLLPEWLDAVETDPLVEAQFQATSRVFNEKLSKVQRGPASARFAILQRQATEYLPIARRHLDLAEIYLSRTIALNPFVTKIVRIVEAHPDSLPLLADLEAAVHEAIQQIGRQKRDGESAAAYARANAHVSRAMSTLADVWEKADRIVREGNQMVLQWETQLVSLHEPKIEAADEPGSSI